MRSLRPIALPLSLVAGFLLVAAPPAADAQEISPEDLDALPFRHVGPVGNRLISAAGVPGRPDVYYVGAASGRIWKTEDGGVHWEPIFDDQPVHGVGALAVAPPDPAILWAGTGEHFIRSNVSHGDGVWKSTDGGETWEHMGLEGAERISEILVHPRDPDAEGLYVAGDWVGPMGMLSDAEVASGRRAAMHILATEPGKRAHATGQGAR